jgi:GNAT superfamily N-acetyltransferase
LSLIVAPLTGAAFQRAIPDLARLRIEVFRDWPYLYDGNYDYERGYIAKFAASPQSVIVAAMDGSRIVGAATGSPLTDHADAFAKPFMAKGYDLHKIFYFGESVLLMGYRGRGIGHRFFDEREAFARKMGRYTHTAFCGVVRPDDHPLKPQNVRSLTPFWEGRGYKAVDGLVAHFDWKDLGQTEKTSKPMQFWMRALS